jgi:hypothetical protein
MSIVSIIILIIALVSLIVFLIIRNFSSRIKYSQIVIFSEGNQYLNTFSPIVKELIKRKVYFNYYTLDTSDELLTIKSEYITPLFLGYGALGFIRFNNIKTKVLLSTTPNIGNKNFPLQRPKNVEYLVHIWHSISDIGYYRKGSLDNYDIILNVGEFQKKSIQEITKQRATKIKEMFSVGLPYYDSFLRSFNIESINQETILIASSWGKKGLLKKYGHNILRTLKNKKIIIRPHPQSFYSEKKFIQEFKTKCMALPNVHWDESKDPLNSFSKASLLISDTSSIRFDFSFLTFRPVITLKINNDDLQEYECSSLKERWDEKAEKVLGSVIDEKNIQTLLSETDRLLNSFDERDSIQKLKRETLFTEGNSSKKIVDFILSKTNVIDN